MKTTTGAARFSKSLAFHIALSLSASSAVADCLVPSYTMSSPPSFPGTTRTITQWFGCADSLTGKPLDCEFSLSVTGIEQPAEDPANNGGHAHQTGRPLVLNNGPVEFSADTDPAPLRVAGTTLSTPPFIKAQVTHKIPEVAGRLWVETYMVAPSGWTFGRDCDDRVTPTRFRTARYDIGVGALMPLPKDDAIYGKVRSEDNDHLETDAYHGTRFTLQMIPLIAENYLVLSGRMLSVNDMSLPKGGLFDIRGNWSSPHQTHREGRDADINRGGIPCSTDHELRLAVDQLLARVPTPSGGMRSALLCETNNNDSKHIDFEAPLL